MSGKLILLPNLLASAAASDLRLLPALLPELVEQLDGVIGESEKGARSFLKLFRLKGGKPLQQMPVATLNEHTALEDLEELIAPMRKGEVWGLLSDAGLPCLADPGALLVAKAQKCSVIVEAYAGPSSMVLALLLSGLPAQRFGFEWYLPKDQVARQKHIALLEGRSRKEGSTQIFIETPYRSGKLLEELVSQLAPTTKLAYAASLTTAEQKVECRTVAEWRKIALPTLENRPTVFLFLA